MNCWMKVTFKQDDEKFETLVENYKKARDELEKYLGWERSVFKATELPPAATGGNES